MIFWDKTLKSESSSKKWKTQTEVQAIISALEAWETADAAAKAEIRAENPQVNANFPLLHVHLPAFDFTFVYAQKVYSWAKKFKIKIVNGDRRLYENRTLRVPGGGDEL